MFDDWQGLAAVGSAVLIAYGVVLWLGTIVWAYRDIRGRTQDGWSQVVSSLLVVLFNLPGLFLYLILRPHETLTEAYERRLEAEALMRDTPGQATCPKCERAVREDFLLCPHCRKSLRDPCQGCGRGLELSWSACPFCGADGPRSTSRTGAPSAARTEPPSANMPLPPSDGEAQAAQATARSAGTGSSQAGSSSIPPR